MAASAKSASNCLSVANRNPKQTILALFIWPEQDMIRPRPSHSGSGSATTTNNRAVEKTPGTQNSSVPIRSMRHASPNSDRKSTRLNSSHSQISYAVFCLKKKKGETQPPSRHADATDRRRLIADSLRRIELYPRDQSQACDPPRDDIYSPTHIESSVSHRH